MPLNRSLQPPSKPLDTRQIALASRLDDPLDADLTFDDVTMLGFALVAIVGAVALLALGF